MNHGIGTPGGETRRHILRAAALGGTAAAAAALLPAHSASADSRGHGGSQYIEGVDVLPDTSHATSALAAHLRGYFQAKSDRNLTWQTSYYAQPTIWYVDPDTGRYWTDWQEFHDAIAKLYPKWPQGSKSYPTRMLGDTTSAIVFFTDTPGMFGPGQVRNAAAINFNGEGGIERQVDYYDARQTGMAAWQAGLLPQDQWPTDFGESTVGETASPLMRSVVSGLADALRKGDIAAAMEFFSSDAVFEDVPAHIQITSKASIHTYLTKAASVLPYVGVGTGVRHVLGNDVGGGYEWTAAGGPVPHGITGLELDPWGRIERCTAVWNGTLADDAMLTVLAQTAIEQ